MSLRLDGRTAEYFTVKFQMKESFSLYPLPSEDEIYAIRSRKKIKNKPENTKMFGNDP